MYEEDYVRVGHGGTMRRSGEAWNALAEFAKRFMDEYYPDEAEEMMRRSNEYGMHRDILGRIPYEKMRYRGQPRTAGGRFKRVRFGHEHDCEGMKEKVGSMLAETYEQDWLIEKAIKEASEFIKCATEGDEYEMFKEFAELCILMKAVAEFMPEELEEKACEKALEYYARKAEGKDYGNPLLDEYSRRNRMYY
jgi:hypothetical protein